MTEEITLGRKALLNANLVLVTGVSQAVCLKWETGEADGKHTPVDLTGWTCLAQIRNYDELVIDLTPYAQLGSDGVIKFVIPAAATESIDAGRAVWNVILTNPENENVRFIAGTVDIEPRISKESDDE